MSAAVSGTPPAPLRVGRRLLVVPPSAAAPAEPGVLPVRIDPGRAFGNGTHPTTRLCLQALERLVSPGAEVIDLGTGSGILAVAAAQLGAGRVLAVDTDADAVRVARENVAVNGAAGIVRVEHGSLAGVLAGEWGLAQAAVVVANILLGVIVDFFAQGLTRAVRPGGMLILSGVLRTQMPDIRACLGWDGLPLIAQERADEWTCAIARRP